MQICQSKMTLYPLLKRCGADFNRMQLPDSEVSAVVCDSRKVVPGCIFVAVRGTASDGHAFADSALRAGAAVVLSDDPDFEAGGRTAHVKNARRVYAMLNHWLHGEPSSKLKTFAVTGTNGKTTSAYLTHHLLRSDFRPILLGTVEYAFENEVLTSTHTTPDPDVLQPWLARMVALGADSVVLEASSHALDQERLAGMEFDGAMFTNLSQDHLDYHGTLDNYWAAKQKLFFMVRPGGLAVINVDDPSGVRLCGQVTTKLITYGIESEADLRASVTRSSLEGSEFTVRYQGRDHAVRTTLVGRHNVYNILGALGLGLAAGIPLERSVRLLENFKGVPGRLERVPCEQGFDVFVDYAHTPDGILNVLSAVRPYVTQKLLVLFGCGGDRDRTKRPKMAEAVERYADRVVLTSDNPRSENPGEIIRQIRSGFSSGGDKVLIQSDRARAIRQILLEARPGDAVMILGKGHESVQIIGNEKIPFSDREEALQALRGR